MKIRDQLEQQSLLLIGASLIGHAGNYAYHMITGRLLSDNEYGLLMALFGMINLLLIPLSALGLSLTRAVRVDLQQQTGGGLRKLFVRWAALLLPLAGVLIFLSWLFSPQLQQSLGFNRLAPILLTAMIPGLNLLLTLNGSFLQGLERFDVLALRSSLLFLLRALLVGACLLLGWQAAGWALLAHVLGMLAALGAGLLILIPRLPASSKAPPPATAPVLKETLTAMPVLLAFSTLMTADVILARHYFSPEVSGQFAQAATLARMILWLPLPIAQVLFPKVVREGTFSPEQKRTLFKALGYTLLLVIAACASAALFASLGLGLIYGIAPSPEQVRWLRGMALAMLPLGPVYLLLQAELARGKIWQMLPLCLLAPGYLLASVFFHPSPDELILLLIAINTLALISCLHPLRRL